MSQNKKIIDEIIQFIETSIKKGLDEDDFTEDFREKIDNFLIRRLS